MSNQILAMMPQSAGYFRVQVSLWKHYTGDLAENYNDSNLNWDFSVRMVKCTVIDNVLVEIVVQLNQMIIEG